MKKGAEGTTGGAGIGLPPVVPALLEWISSNTETGHAGISGCCFSSSSCGCASGPSCTHGLLAEHEQVSPRVGAPESWMRRAGLLSDAQGSLATANANARDGLLRNAPSAPAHPVPTSPRGRRGGGTRMTGLLGTLILMSCSAPAMPYRVPGCTRPILLDSGCSTNVFDEADPTLGEWWQTRDAPMDTLGGKAPANSRGTIKVPHVSRQEAVLAPVGTPNCISLGRQVLDHD